MYSVKDSYLENVPRPPTSISMWNALTSSLEPNVLLLKTQLLTEIVIFSLSMDSNVEDSLLSLTKLMSSFNSITPKALSGSDLSLMILFVKLPNELLLVRSELMNDKLINFETAQTRVLQELRLFTM